MARNPKFTTLLAQMAELHDKKNEDYASDGNPYSNFEYAAQVAAIFTDPEDRVYATLLGIKLARIAELRRGKTPKNEPLHDSYKDATTYMAIWASKHLGDQ